MGTNQHDSEPSVKAVFFDLDGTLLDHVLAEQRAAQVLYEKYSSILRASTLEAFAKDWETASEKHMDQFLRGNIGFEEQRRRRISDVVLHPVSHEEADRIFSDYLATYEANWTPFPEVVDVLETLREREVRMSVITNGDSVQQKNKLQTLALAQFFEHILISGELGISKPSKEVFQTAADLMGCGTAECIHIGDSFDNDVKGAMGAGMPAVWLDRGGNGTPPEAGDGYTRIRNLREVLGFEWLQ